MSFITIPYTPIQKLSYQPCQYRIQSLNGNVSDDEVKAAIRHLFHDTHNLVEGAGAAPLAALMKDPERKGERFAVIASGGNIDREMYLEALAG